jgi:hypothetical protein
MDEGRRTFPNATLRAAASKMDGFLNPDRMKAAPKAKKAGLQALADRFQPHIKAGRISAFNEDSALVPGNCLGWIGKGFYLKIPIGHLREGAAVDLQRKFSPLRNPLRALRIVDGLRAIEPDLDMRLYRTDPVVIPGAQL